MDTPTIKKVFTILAKEVEGLPLPIMDLHSTHGGDPFKVLVGTVMSARTKDGQTAAACRKLFKKVKTPQDLRNISEKELKELIYPVGFYITKAKNLKKLGEQLKAFDDLVPQTIEELITLAGVGRKTANLTVCLAFDLPGICVDTHVHRIMNRFDYVRTKDPHETEMRLRKKLPIELWKPTNRVLVAYGQHTCTPISPHCSKCKIKKYCPQRGVGSMR